MKPIYEFIAWENCCNKCSFCFQRENPNFLASIEKEKSLFKILRFLDSDEFKKGSHVLIVGGEIFDSPNNSEIIYDCYNELIKKMLNNDIDLLYINTNLIYRDKTLLGSILCLLEKHKLLERVKFTTSYDFEGRFKSDEDRQLMLNNLKSIKSQFPDLPIVTNIILTDKACNEILEKRFDFEQFMEEYKCWINFIPYLIYNKELSAIRFKIFRALNYINKVIPGYIERYIANLDLPQDKLLYKYNKESGELDFVSCENMSCGHSENFKLYSEKGSCFICDLKGLFHVK